MLGDAVDADGLDATAQEIAHEVEAGLEDACHNDGRPVILSAKGGHGWLSAPGDWMKREGCFG